MNTDNRKDVMTGSAALPLAGFRILDFSRLLPGPWCTNLLAGLGAEVIKVEAPEGDPSRHNPPFGTAGSIYFDGVNCNKRNIVLDLKSADDRAHADALLAKADVVIESFRAGVADKLGIGYDHAKERNPRVIYCSISGFGRTGGLAAVPGHDLIIQALSGLLGVDGRETGEMRVPAFQAGDYAAAAFASIAILSALVGDPAKRESRYLDISMLDSLLAMGGINFAPALSRQSGGKGDAQIQVWGKNPRYSIYRTADNRSVAVCLLEKGLWSGFCRKIGRADLISSSEISSDRHSDHGGQGEAYRSAIAKYCSERTLSEHQRIMMEDSVPIAPVLTPEEVLASSFISDRGMIADYTHSNSGTSGQRLANPLLLVGLASMSSFAAPGMDEHSAEILQELSEAGSGGLNCTAGPVPGKGIVI